MNKKVLEEFLKDPLIKGAYRTDGLEELARLASMVGNLEKNEDLRGLAEDLSKLSLKKREKKTARGG